MQNLAKGKWEKYLEKRKNSLWTIEEVSITVCVGDGVIEPKNVVDGSTESIVVESTATVIVGTPVSDIVGSTVSVVVGSTASVVVGSTPNV